MLEEEAEQGSRLLDREPVDLRGEARVHVEHRPACVGVGDDDGVADVVANGIRVADAVGRAFSAEGLATEDVRTGMGGGQ